MTIMSAFRDCYMFLNKKSVLRIERFLLSNNASNGS